MSVDSKIKKEAHQANVADDAFDLLKLQKNTISELQENHDTLASQKEINELKVSTFNLLASKNAKELSVLKREIHLYEVSLEEQVQQMRQLQIAITESGRDIEAKKNEFEGLKKDIFLKKRRAVDERKDLKNINDEITEYNEKLVRIKGEIEAEAGLLAQLEKELQCLKNEHTAKASELENLFIELMTSKKRHEALKAQKEQLQRNITRNKHEIETSSSELVQSQKQVEQLDQDIATLVASFERKNLEYSNLREELSKSFIQLDQKRMTFEEELQREQNISTKLVETKDKFESTEAELSKKQDQLFEIRRNIEHQKSQMVIFEEQNAGLSISIIQCEKEINKNEAIQASLDTTLRSLKKTLEELTSRHGLLTQDVAGRGKQVTDTRSEIGLVEKEIHKLQDAILEVSEKVREQEKSLNILETEKSTLLGLKAEKGQELKEKESISLQQTEHIEELRSLLQESQQEYSHLLEKSKVYSQKLEENKKFLVDLNVNLDSSENYLGDVRNRVRVALSNIQESDAEIFQSLKELEIKKLDLQDLDRNVCEKLRSIASNKEIREKELCLYLENLGRVQSELQRRLNTTETLKQEIETTKYDLTNTKNQIQILGERTEKSAQRNQQLQMTLDDQAMTLISLKSQKEELSKGLENQIKIENSLLAKIEEKVNIHHQLQVEYNTLLENENQLKTIIEKENQQLDHFQQEEHSKRKMLAEKHNMIVGLKEYQDELQLANNDYSKKIEVQNRQIEDNSTLIESLSKKNKYLIEQLAKYEEAYNRNTKHADAQKESVDGLKAMARDKEVLLTNQSEKIEKSVSDFSPVALAELANLEKAIDVTALDQMHAFKRSLESRFFNLTVNIDENVTFMDNLVEAESINVASSVHISILQAVENCFTSGAEVLLDVRSDQKGLFTTMSISSIRDVSSQQAKNIMVPVAKQMMTKFAQHDMTVNYRIKLNSSGNIDKLIVDCKLAYPAGLQKKNSDKTA